MASLNYIVLLSICLAASCVIVCMYTKIAIVLLKIAMRYRALWSQETTFKMTEGRN